MLLGKARSRQAGRFDHLQLYSQRFRQFRPKGLQELPPVYPDPIQRSPGHSGKQLAENDGGKRKDRPSGRLRRELHRGDSPMAHLRPGLIVDLICFLISIGYKSGKVCLHPFPIEGSLLLL
jgi:hypothetical protein